MKNKKNEKSSSFSDAKLYVIKIYGTLFATSAKNLNKSIKMKSLLIKTTTAAATLIFSLPVFAQKADAKSKSLLESVAANYRANKNSYFKFVYGTGANGKVTKTETGIFYTTPSQYKLKIMGNEQIFDGNKVYNISAEDQEVTIAKANGSEQALSPTNYLTTYKKDFNTSYVGRRSVNGTSADLIKLTPVKSNGIKSVYIFVDAARKQIVKIEQLSSNNAVTTLAVKEYKANQNLSADMFSFDKNKYKNYIITEL